MVNLTTCIVAAFTVGIITFLHYMLTNEGTERPRNNTRYRNANWVAVSSKL